MAGAVRWLMALAVAGAPLGLRADETKVRLELEGGPVWQSRNDFAVPGDTGTRVELPDDGPFAAFRGTLTWDVSRSSTLRLLVAPLSTATTFTPTAPVVFQGTTFAADRPLTVDYKFNSYRLSWYRRIREDRRWSFRLGGTVKVRDARIGLTSDGAAEKSNVGVVPLVYLAARFKATDRLAFELEADALAAPQGRAEDATLRAELRLSDRATAFAGYRLLEGGADNDEVYTFALFQYAVAGLRFAF